ncbi:hypothetical protein [Pseudoxanthomonas wuyuanensis]|uniref:hypothetical protein n=1 Tax=Pseudoxanthomonas wuyuanensis TaxID=1073196 RepID=UPI001144ED83|nr:hypothetical protein [Pseudoxanthomonas wuyuanensis]
MKIYLLTCFALMVACSQPPPTSSSSTSIVPSPQCSVFGDVELTEVSAPDRAIFNAASADYCAVLAGQHPVHAKLDTSFRRSHNGSTARYIGEGYSLLEVRDVRFIGGVPVGVFGPVLKFDDQISEDGLEISQLRLVSTPVQH